ncbi:MAG: redoxin domain-containing protein [Candidatus Bathyarchaeota archaeon]
MKIEVGRKAHDFELFDSEMKLRKLSEFLGAKVVIAFFPAAFTPVCEMEMCHFRDSLANLNEMEVQVVGISVNDPFTLKAFAERNNLNFALLSDYNHKVTQLYGIALENLAGLTGYVVAKRSIFILDEEGIVRYKWVSDDPLIEPNYAEIRNVVAQIT